MKPNLIDSIRSEVSNINDDNDDDEKRINK
jgi:hypothetical protein